MDNLPYLVVKKGHVCLMRSWPQYIFLLKGCRCLEWSIAGLVLQIYIPERYGFLWTSAGKHEWFCRCPPWCCCRSSIQELWHHERETWGLCSDNKKAIQVMFHLAHWTPQCVCCNLENAAVSLRPNEQRGAGCMWP